jgi:hypothetical protein
VTPFLLTLGPLFRTLSSSYQISKRRRRKTRKKRKEEAREWVERVIREVETITRKRGCPND